MGTDLFKNGMNENQFFGLENNGSFHYEIEIWVRSLNCRLEENLLMKGKLSLILKQGFEPGFLDEVEEFQTHLVKEDELILSLKKEIGKLENDQVDYFLEHGKPANLPDKKILSLRKKIVKSAIRFHKLQAAFNDFDAKISNTNGC